MSKINDIIRKYTDGEQGIEETNAALKEAGAGFFLQPDKQTITPDEVAQGDARNGFGMLFTGTGYPDKVRIEDMRIANGNVGGMEAYVEFNGKRYRVAEDGETLVE